jgi:hypothetical protein
MSVGNEFNETYVRRGELVLRLNGVQDLFWEVFQIDPNPNTTRLELASILSGISLSMGGSGEIINVNPKTEADNGMVEIFEEEDIREFIYVIESNITPDEYREVRPTDTSL